MTNNDKLRAALRAVLHDIRTGADGLSYETLQQVFAALCEPGDGPVSVQEVRAMVYADTALIAALEALATPTQSASKEQQP